MKRIRLYEGGSPFRIRIELDESGVLTIADERIPAYWMPDNPVAPDASVMLPGVDADWMRRELLTMPLNGRALVGYAFRLYYLDGTHVDRASRKAIERVARRARKDGELKRITRVYVWRKVPRAITPGAHGCTHTGVATLTCTHGHCCQACWEAHCPERIG